MSINCRLKSVKTEAQMSQAVACNLGKYAAREVKVGDCIFDVVAYNKKEKLFRLVECKKSSKASKIGHAFGQVAASGETGIMSSKKQSSIEAARARARSTPAACSSIRMMSTRISISAQSVGTWSFVTSRVLPTR